MHIEVTHVEAIKKYELFIKFSDGTQGSLDLKDLSGKGVFKLWEQPNMFQQVFIDNESKAITWPGEIDIDTINAYCTINKISPEFFFKQNETYA